ncbi:nose resistant to fluoxetine protein 6-like [Littorina saxatilis]|uniref:Nose resistant-to-fluoxetine protein N-terminal domain-containing protein n=1 Tax=Littorina saxatilis TaxID=31220 RepID=A0AAN9AY75_9CAEN
MARPCSPHSVLLALILLTVSPAQICTQSIPSYAELFTKASNIVNATKPETRRLLAAELQRSWPLLTSPTLFQHELVQAVERLATNGSVQWDLPYNLSAQCVGHFEHLLSALAERKGWAWQMVDAMGKPSPDLKDINLLWVGGYKECLSVKAFNQTNNSSADLLFSGRHCYTEITLAQPSATTPIALQLVMSLCVPDSCSAYDVSVLMNLALAELQIKLPAIPYAVCNEESKSLDGLAIAGIAVGGVFVLLMLLGTAVDILYCQLPKWRSESVDSLPTNTKLTFHTYHDDDIVLLGNLPAKVSEPSFAAKLVMAFSVYTNGAKLLSTQRTAGSLTCIHGVRFLSMTWVVLGHTILLPLGGAGNTIGYIGEAIQRWTFQGILNATLSVDSFFVMSGLLVAYLSLKELKRTGGKINWIKFYFHRFWRLTPPYLLVILMYLSLGKYWGSGPMWADTQPDRDNCRKSWWTNLLYINNFVHDDHVCLGQSWYLANDMQFYILSPLIFVPLYCSPLYGTAAVLVFLIATIITPAAVTMKWHLAPGIIAPVDAAPNGGNYMMDYYIKPYNRMGPYLVGMVTGYFLYRTDCKCKLPKVVNVICWCVAAACALAVLYGLYHTSQGHPMSLPVSALHNAVSRTVWGAAVAWVIFACVTGNGGFVNSILSWKALVPLSRLTYCIYLLHIMTLYGYLFSRDTVFYYSDANVVVLFLATLVACYMLSAVVSLAFEAPMMALEKVILNYKKND